MAVTHAMDAEDSGEEGTEEVGQADAIDLSGWIGRKVHFYTITTGTVRGVNDGQAELVIEDDTGLHVVVPRTLTLCPSTGQPLVTPETKDWYAVIPPGRNTLSGNQRHSDTHTTRVKTLIVDGSPP